MDIVSAIAPSVGAIVNSPQPPVPQHDKQPEKQQDFAVVVKLSAQAQQMSRDESRNNNAERAETRPQETAEPPGIRFIGGENKGGRINTFA